MHLALQTLHRRAVLQQHQFPVGQRHAADEHGDGPAGDLAGGRSLQLDTVPARLAAEPLGGDVAADGAAVGAQLADADRQRREHGVALGERLLQRRIGGAQFAVDGVGAGLQRHVAALQFARGDDELGEAVGEAFRREGHFASAPGQTIASMVAAAS